MVFVSRGGASGGPGGNIASGTYVGTGTYGAENPTVIHIPFIPRLVLIYGTQSGNHGVAYPIYAIPENAVGICQVLSGSFIRSNLVSVEISDFDIKIYTNRADFQGNEAGVEYFWIAFG